MDRTAAARMKRYRDKKRNIAVTGNVTIKGQTVTDRVKGITANVTAYHPVLEYLIDPGKREKLGRIIPHLQAHLQLENVYLGCGRYSLPMNIVAGYYEATLT